jgi:anti-sigma factor RsiW
MNTEIILKLQAYLDEELTAEEARQVSAWLASDAEAQAVCRHLRDTKALLAGNELPVKVPETQEFYWSKIQREITRLEAASDHEPPPVLARWWMRLAVPLAGVAVLVLLLLMLVKPLSESGALAGSFHEIETQIEEANAISFHSQAAGMTVVWIDSGSN